MFEDQLTTLAQIQEYRRAVVSVMQAAFHVAYPSHKLAVRRRKFVTAQVQKEHALLALFQKLSQHKVRRALLFWRAYVWQTPEDTGGSEAFFFAPASKVRACVFVLSVSVVDLCLKLRLPPACALERKLKVLGGTCTYDAGSHGPGCVLQTAMDRRQPRSRRAEASVRDLCTRVRR